MNSQTGLSEENGARQPETGPSRKLAVAANRVVYWISRYWLLLINLAVLVLIGLPFMAPVLMHVGAEPAADIIYKLYSPACHQMGFRSWFLFGEQSYYPLRDSNISGVKYFEEYVLDDPAFAGLDSESDFFLYSWQARSFVGNEQMGYKVALCQRDTAMYLSLLLGGLIFWIFKKLIRPLPWQLFAVFGVLPMLMDGGYQLLTKMFPAFLSTHETTPLLRTLTGALFGFGLVWLTYPEINNGMVEIENEIKAKLTRAKLVRGE